MVPNPTLQDNHQEELAGVLQDEGYAIWGHYRYSILPRRWLTSSGLLTIHRQLPATLDRAEILRTKMLSWPPVHGKQERQPQDLAGVVSEEMGYLD